MEDLHVLAAQDKGLRRLFVFLLQLDLYNQRILEKREQQYKEKLARKKQGERNKDGTLISPGIRTF